MIIFQQRGLAHSAVPTMIISALLSKKWSTFFFFCLFKLKLDGVLKKYAYLFIKLLSFQKYYPFLTIY